ncbi:MAG: AAA domain-containing protein, partial [Halobacteria archaeon]|nr:AAA domain-containing protein [Halobacteria archaeon]
MDAIETYDVGGRTQTEEGGTGTSVKNPDEARLVVKLVDRLVSQTRVSPDEIGVITPYSAQVRELESRFSHSGATPTVDTVDSFQGGEKTAIFVSMVRSNADGEIGFMARRVDGKRRFNVALSRAQRYCCIVGDWETFTNPGLPDEIRGIYETMYDSLESTGRLRSFDVSLL